MGRFEAWDVLYIGRFGAGTFWGWDLMYLDVLSLDVLSLDVMSLVVLYVHPFLCIRVGLFFGNKLHLGQSWGQP